MLAALSGCSSLMIGLNQRTACVFALGGGNNNSQVSNILPVGF